MASRAQLESPGVTGGYRQRLLFTLAAISGMVILFSLIWQALQVFLLVFAGILLALVIQSPARWLNSHTRLTNPFSVLIVLLALVTVIGSFSAWVLPQVAQQLDQMARQIPEALVHLQQRILQYEWARNFLTESPIAEGLLSSPGNIFGRIGGFLSTTLGWIINIVIILFTGLYIAFEPGLYQSGLIRLLPKRKRRRAKEVLDGIAHNLRWWLVGKFLSMTIVGILISTGLTLLDMPLALSLGVFAALFDFIPNIGPTLAALPAILLGLSMGPEMALYVTLLYLGVQFVESYLITPFIERQTVRLPPALTMGVIVTLGLLAGGLGLFLAAPLTVALMVAVKMVYVHDVLGDETPDT